MSTLTAKQPLRLKRKSIEEIRKISDPVASMSGAGMPILTTMQTLEEQSGNPEFKKAMFLPIFNMGSLAS